MMNAQTLRNLVTENAFDMGRLSREQVDKDTYDILTTHYRAALDAITDWAKKNERHAATKEDVDNAFLHVKNALNLFATDESRIVIDQQSMLSLRDRATKPVIKHTQAYLDAKKAMQAAEKTWLARSKDLIDLHAPKPEVDESAADFVARVRASGVNTVVDGLDMLEMWNVAFAQMTIKTNAFNEVKARGHHSWSDVAPVSDNKFAELFEQYVAKCLECGENMKSSKDIRDERAAAAAAARAAKA